MSKKTIIRIGNASGYWGDDPGALFRQVNGGRLDYITMDFLAEITMSIMQKQRKRDPEAGYARDFIPMLESVLKKMLSDGTKIITNAGGVNPEACAEAISQMAMKLGLRPKIAVVYGDDINDRLAELEAKGCKFSNMEDGRNFSEVNGRIAAANVYFGAAPVVAALKMSPDIIITGRVTDTGITLAPMIHELGWSLDDWNKLSAGIVAGHIIECGTHSTGGNFTDWHLVPSFDNPGYPIVEMQEDGTFFVTKHPGSGGLVSVDTVREQLFYEMGNPVSYLTPDVVADFSTIQLEAAGENRVKVFGIRGYEPTPLYKVSMAYADGFKSIGEIAISGPDARKKAEKFAEIFWKKVGTDFAATETEYVGYNAFHRGMGHEDEGNEIILRLGARDSDQRKLKTFGKMIPALILGGPPGVAILGGVPRIQEIMSYWPALIPKNATHPMIAFYDNGYTNISEIDDTLVGHFTEPPVDSQVAEKVSLSLSDILSRFKKGDCLSTICLGRSGDKGDTSNIGVIARSKKSYDFLEKHITAQVVKDLFQELCQGRVIRYSVPNMLGFNFLLEGSLGGGGTMTLRSDAQGKMFAQALLRQKIEIPQDILNELKK